MLSPEVSDFPPPKVYVFRKDFMDIETAIPLIEMNNFYKSVIVTCSDEHDVRFVERIIMDDTVYYKLTNCPITELTNPNFIGYFVKCGKITCLSADTNCIVQNCVALTPDGILTLHVMEPVYQTLGLQGMKRQHGYYEVKINLHTLTQFTKQKDALAKLGVSDFYITWEPDNDKICPSSVARYFFDKNINVTAHKITFETKSHPVKYIPSLVDVETEDLVEWMGILAHEGDVCPQEKYISTYSEPSTFAPVLSTKLSIMIAKGFITPITLVKLCNALAIHAEAITTPNYWIAMSIQGFEESLWKFSASTPRMFNSHNTSTSIIFGGNACSIYSAAQLKYS